MATKINSSPVYCCISDDEIVIVNRDLSCYYLGYYHNAYSKKGDNITGVLGGYYDSNQPASVYLGKTFDQSLNNKGLQVYDCTNNPNEVYLNCTDRKITTTYNSAYVPIFCVATGIKNEVLAVAKNGDIYGGNMNSGAIIKIGTVNGAYRCVIDYDVNMNAMFFIIALDGSLRRISAYASQFSVLATATNVYDVCFNRCSSILNGTGIIALKRDNCLYKLTSDTLAQSGNALVSSVGLLMHQSQVGWAGTQTGYITLDGTPMYNVYGSSFNAIIADTKTWTYAKPSIEPTNIINLPSETFGKYDKSPNGLVYNYRVKYVYGGYINNSNVVNYVTEWGTDANYGNTFSTKSKTFNATTATNSVQTLSQLAEAEIKELQKKLDTYIGPFTKPNGRKSLAAGFKANNGTTYFWETTISADSNNTSLTATQASIKFTTKWGTSANNLDKTYINTAIKDDNTTRAAYSTASTGMTTYTVKPGNFAARDTIIKEILDKHEQGVQQQLNSYIGPVSNLDDVKASITSAGDNYYAKVTRKGTETNATATRCTMSLELTWSKGTESYSSKYGSVVDVDIVSTNYTTRDQVTKNQANALIEKWKEYVKTLFGTVDKPASKTDTWGATTGNVWVQMDFALGTKSESEQVINTTFKYSLVNSTCNNTYKTDSLTINSSNYVSRASEYTAHFNKIYSAFKNDYSFLNVAPIEEKTMNYQAVNGITYTYKFKWDYANSRDLTKAVYKLATTYGESSDKATTSYRNTTTLNITQANASYNIRIAAFNEKNSTEEAALKAYLDTLVIKATAPSAITKTHVATNGVTYAYRISCSITPVDGTKSNVTIKSEWGKTTNYGNAFATSTFVLTAVNQSVFTNTTNRLMTAHETKLKGFLNTLIDNITFNGKSGQNLASNGAYYYYRTNVTGVSTTDTTAKQYIGNNGAIE